MIIRYNHTTKTLYFIILEKFRQVAQCAFNITLQREFPDISTGAHVNHSLLVVLIAIVANQIKVNVLLLSRVETDQSQRVLSPRTLFFIKSKSVDI